MHGKSVPINATTLGAETFSRGTPEVFLNPQGRNARPNIAAAFLRSSQICKFHELEHISVKVTLPVSLQHQITFQVLTLKVRDRTSD